MTLPSGFALALHGGAGTLSRRVMTPELEGQYHAGLRRALIAGYEVLAGEGSALDAVTAAVLALEDDPLFNAGRGAVFTAAGTQEMDAAVMDGRTHRAGAVAGIFGPRNPILAARAVMERSPHVLLAGPGATAFCRAQGLSFVEPDYFRTESRWQALQDLLERRRLGLSEGEDAARRHGTVGAVARDGAGNLAAATSTGGISGKLPGRVGDSPIIGAGTYADNLSCAVSATGDGEVFLRFCVGHEIAARLRLAKETLPRAAVRVIREVGINGGSGGAVAVDRYGTVALPFNCGGMYRGYVKPDGRLHTAIYQGPYRSSPGGRQL